MLAASYDNWAGLGLGVVLLALLVMVLIVPERF